MNFPKLPTFNSTPQTEPIMEFAFPLMASCEGVYFASGTAVIVAPYLAITAKHVVEDFFQRFEGRTATIQDHGKFSLQAIQLVNNGNTGNLWDITRVWGCPFTDVAFLRLTPRSKGSAQHKWRGPRLSLFPPPIGSRIVGFGFHSSTVTLETNEHQVTLTHKDDPATTVGEVVEIHDRMRDSVRMPFPCFRTNARFDGGMSGGPVFNDAGRLCGIVCSSFPASAEFPDHASYVSTLWPAMGTIINMEWKERPSERYPVLELVSHGIIHAEGFDRVFVTTNEDGTPGIGLRH